MIIICWFSLLALLSSFTYLTAATEKLKIFNDNNYNLVFPLKLSNTSTSLSINLTNQYFTNQLYAVYFDIIISNEIFDVNNRLKYKSNINKQNGQFLKFKLSINNNDNNILLYESKDLDQNHLKFFSSVFVSSNNTSLDLDFSTYLKNYAWNYRSFNKIVSINNIIIFPMNNVINEVGNQDNIQSHHYNLLMKFFLEDMSAFDYQDGISLLLTNEFTKRNYNESTLNWIKYTFVISTVIFALFQLVILFLYYKKI